MFSPFKEQLLKSPNPQAKKLRVGLMINEDKLIPVFAEIIKDLNASDFVDLCLVITKRTYPVAKRSALSRIWGFRKYLTDKKLRATLLFRLYSLIDARQNKDVTLFDEVSIADQLRGISRLEVAPEEKGFSDYFLPDDITLIQAENLDVLLRFGFRILRGDILTSAKYGVWSYHHGDQDFYRGSPPYFWEQAEGASLHGVILQILNERLDDGKVLLKGRFAARKQFSLKKTKVTPYMGSQHFVLDQLRRLHSEGGETFVASLGTPQPFLGKKAIYRSPTNFEMLGWIFRYSLEKLQSRVNKRETFSHWRIGIRKRDDAYLERLRQGVTEVDYRWLESPRDHFWADPRLFDYKGKTFLFFEDYSYSNSRGVIACAEVDDEFRLSNIVTVLDTGKHASFPHVFEDQGHIYMVPETSEEGTVSLYVAVDFPKKWEKIKTLVDLPCVDTIVWKQDGLWWLVTSYSFGFGHTHTILIYNSSSLMGEWQLHPSAPFAPDVRFARNAGSIISDQSGNLFRVSQSSEHSYGSSIAFHKIIELTPRKYSETIERVVLPSVISTMRGIHSFSQSTKFEAIDAVWNELKTDVA
jgi:hypothetical protein